MAGSIDQTDNVLPSPLVIEVSADAQQSCVFNIAGRLISESALRHLLDSEGDKKREIHIFASSHAPWRCVAGAVQIAQSSGFGTVGFITEPNSK